MDFDQNEFSLIMDTNWMFKDPLDFEHKKYVLLSYLNKVDEFIDEHKIYPIFSEISLHFANVESLITNKQLLKYDETLKYYDEEILISKIIRERQPKISKDEVKDLDQILKFAEIKFYEYFNLCKITWEKVYKNTQLILRKNKNKLSDGIGFMFYKDSRTKKYYVWEFNIKTEEGLVLISESKFDLIYHGEIKRGERKEIIKNNTIMFKNNFDDVVHVTLKSKEPYPILESIFPIFKRKLIYLIGNQKF